MADPIKEAFMILMVGMASVFFILSLVVLTGNILIRTLKVSNFIFNKETADEAGDKLPQELIERTIQKWSNGKATVKHIQKL